MFDTHTHCMHSHDSQQDPEELVKYAIEKGLEYIAVTDHYDGELTLLPEFSYIPQIDLDNHFKVISFLKEKYRDKIEVGVGIECGFMREADGIYLENLKKYDTDIIINSVHTIEYEDCYEPSYFAKRTKRQAYYAYLKAVRDSLDVPYHYDSVGHIGYVIRKSTYDDISLDYKDYSDILDDILKTIISKGKALELNSHSEGTGLDFMASPEITKRYKELGGELLTFGSDAHRTNRLCANYDKVCEKVKALGFKYLFKYLNHKPVAVKI